MMSLPEETIDAVPAQMTPAFIQATEVWVPDEAGTHLTRASGVYGSLSDFATASAEETFAKGEGLPGTAWAEARPVVLKEFTNSIFRRAEIAAAAGLTAAIAIPVFAGETLKGVLVLLCGNDDKRTGAIEVWQAEEKFSGPMHLEDGYFGAAKHFEWVSQRTQFPRGQGLPGGVWAAGAPLLLRDLGRSYSFVRAESAGEAGLTTGLGLPIRTPKRSACVVTLLSAKATPIATRFEIWEVTQGRGGQKAEAILTDGLCEQDGPLWGSTRKVAPWIGTVGRALGSGMPIAETGSTLRAPDGRPLSTVALPIHNRSEITHIAAWYF